MLPDQQCARHEHRGEIKNGVCPEWHSVKHNVFVNNYLCWPTAGSFIRGKACLPEAKQRLSSKSAHVGGWAPDSRLEGQIAMSP